MPNLTPIKYRRLYEIYPNKKCIGEEPAKALTDTDRLLKNLGRRVSGEYGDSPKPAFAARGAAHRKEVIHEE
jgi:biotin synthase